MEIKPETEPTSTRAGETTTVGTSSPAARNPAGQLEQEGARDLDTVLNHVSSMIGSLLDRLHKSEEVLRDAGLKTVQSTSNKLEEVTTTTETAATEILDNLDRSLALVDRIEGGEEGENLCDQLRDELLGAINQLQFQDIAAQQISHVMSLLGDLEGQLEAFAREFDEAAAGDVVSPERPARAFDPNATFDGADGRQALVDQLLAG